MPSDYITPKEAAMEFRLSQTTIYNLIRSGKVPALKIGDSYRISRSAVHRATATETPGFFSYTHDGLGASDRRP